MGGDPDMTELAESVAVTPTQPGILLTMFPAPLRWTSGGRRRAATWEQIVSLADKPSLWPAEPSIAASENLLVGLTFTRLKDDTRVLARDADRARMATEERVEDVCGLIIEYVDEPMVDEEHLRQWWGRWGFVAYTTAFNHQPLADRPPGPRWRVLLPFSRPVPLARARPLARWARHSRRSAGSVDAATEDLARVVAVPAVAPGGYRWISGTGPLVDPEFIERQLQQWAEQDRALAAARAVAGATLAEAVTGFQVRIATPELRALLPWPGGVQALPRDGELGPLPVPDLSNLARLAGSLWPGRIAVLIGPSGSGRSSLALQVADAAARSGHPVLYASAALPTDEVIARLLVLRSAAGGAAVPGSHAAVLEGWADGEQLSAACAALAETCPLLFPWTPTTQHRTDEALRARVLGVSEKALGRAPLVIIDPVEGFEDAQSLHETYRDLSAVARDIARAGSLAPEFPGAAVLVVVDAPCSEVSSLSTANALEDLARDPESLLALSQRLTAHIGGLGADASLVLALATDRGDAAVRDATIAVAKNRHGHVGVVRLRFYGAAGLFHEASSRGSGSPW
jgi:hypothetical protein